MLPAPGQRRGPAGVERRGRSRWGGTGPGAAAPRCLRPAAAGAGGGFLPPPPGQSRRAMERLRLRLPRLLAAADPERGAGIGRASAPEAVGPLRTEAELLLIPGTPTGTAEPPSPQGTPGGPRAGREGTRPTGRDGRATEHRGPLLPAGIAEQAAAGSEWPSPASLGVTGVGTPAPAEPDTAPTTRSPPETNPVGNAMAESATTPQGTLLHPPSSVMVPGSAAGQWGLLSTLQGWSPMGTALVQSQRGSHSPLSSELWTGEGPGATVPLGDSSPGTPPSITLATDSPAPGATGTSPFGGGLQRLLTPMGTLEGTRQGLPGLGLAGGRGSDSRLWHGTDIAWQGPHSAPRSSPLSLGAGGRGGPVASAAWPAVGTGPTSLPAAGKGSGLPVPTTTAGAPGMTSPGVGGALDPATGILGPPNMEGPPEHSHVPLEQTWHPPAVPGQPPTTMAPGSTAVTQSWGSYTSQGSPRGSPASPAPAVPTLPTPRPSPGTRWVVLGLSPTAGTPPTGPSPGTGLPHAGAGGDAAESPQILGGTPMGVSSAGPLAATAPPSWQPGSLDPPSAPGPPQQPAASQPVSSPGLTTAIGIAVTAAATTITAATAVTTATTITATTTSPALLRDVGTVTLEPGATVLQRDVTGLTGGPPTPLPTVMSGSPQQPTDPPGTLGHRGSPGSPPAAGDTDLVRLPSSPRERPDADTPPVTPAAAGRAPRVFIVEDQPPLLRASLLRIPCELVLDMGFVPALQDPTSREHRGLLHSFNRTVSPLFMSLPGFLRLEVTGIREGSVVLQYDALFAAERVQAPGLGALLDAVLGSSSARPGLVVGAAPVLRNVALERPLDPCAALFACRAGFACVAGADGNATCTSLCHRGYCKNHGICTHPPDHQPLCQCPAGSDFWFMGLRCDYRVTQQSLLGMAAGVLLSIVLLGAVVAAVAIRRFKMLLLEARADQTRSSYRRFCRLDDVSAQYWSYSWLPSASSLDNPAFSNSEELLHLQILDNSCCSCREDSGITNNAKQRPAPLARPACRPSFPYDWDTSSSSMNDPMVDSGKASDISVSSWPMEPIQWTPFPLLHQLSRQRPHKARRPHSYCEGMELVNLERSWTA
uniref:IMPG2 protein n=1 Tax=Falco tinnunculus TaxID=100819 RepID=A0A8C4UY47_FALTI